MKRFPVLSLCFSLAAFLVGSPRVLAQSTHYAIEFDGADDDVEVPAMAGTSFTQFTFSCWVKLSNYTHPDYMGPIAQVPSDGSGSQFQFFTSNARAFGPIIQWTDNTSFDGRSTYVLPLNEWHHVAATYDGITVRVYDNGTLVFSDIDSGKTYSSNDVLMIGKTITFPGTTTTSFFNGQIDEVRVYNTALTESVLKTTMNHRLTGAESGLVSNWRFDEGAGTSAADISGNNLTGTLYNGPQWVSSTAPVVNPGNYALQFDGSDDYVQIPKTSQWDVGQSSFTIAAWFKATAGGQRNIVRYDGPSSGALYLLRINAENKIDFYVAEADRNTVGCATPLTYTDDQWHHVAAVRDSANDLMEIFVDGNLVVSTSGQGVKNILGSSDAALTIGAAGALNVEYFQGSLDDVSLWNVARTRTEILGTMYHQLTGNEYGLMGNWQFDEGIGAFANDISGFHNTGTLVNGPIWATSAVPVNVAIDNYALQFDGTESYVNLGNANAFNFGSDDFAISFWAKPNYAGGDSYDHVVAKAASSSYAPFIIGIHGYRWKFWSSSDPGSGWDIALGYDFGEIANGAWQHITVTRTGEAISFYINGKQTAALATTLPLWNNTDSLLIGKITYDLVDTHYMGLLDELSLWSVGRTQSQVLESMYRPILAGETGLIASWSCNEGSGSTVYDLKTSSPGLLSPSTSFTVSTAFLGGDEGTKVVASAGDVMFGGNSLLASFTSKIGTDTIRVVKLTSLPDGTQPTGVVTLHAGYWSVRSTTNGSFMADLTFGLGAGALTLTDQEHPGNIRLYRRDAGSIGAWTLVGTASNASFGSATFEGITSFGEFAIGTTDSSSMIGSNGVFQSVAGGLWENSNTWQLIGGTDVDGIPDADDDVTVGDGHALTIAASTTSYVRGLVLRGARNGMRLNLEAGSGLVITGTLTSDDTVLATNLIAGNGQIQFAGGSRQLFGSHWSADPLGWFLNISLAGDQVGTAVTHIRAGSVYVSSGTFQVGTPEAPRDLRADMGSSTTGTLDAGGGKLVVSGNICRTEDPNEQIQSLNGYNIDFGGSIISADVLNLGYMYCGYYSCYSYPANLTVRSANGISFNVTSANFYYIGEQTYAGTVSQLTGGELTRFGSPGNIIINNPAGVTLTTSAGWSYLTLTSGNLNVPAGTALSVSYFQGNSGEIKGGGDVSIGLTFESKHPAGTDAIAITGTLAFGWCSFTFDGAVPQSTGSLLPLSLSSIAINNPAGVTLTHSTAMNYCNLTGGNFSIAASDTVYVDGTISCTGGGAFAGSGAVEHRSGSISLGYPNGFDDMLLGTTTYHCFPSVYLSIYDGTIATGTKGPDTIYVLQRYNSGSLTLSRSLTASYIYDYTSSNIVIPSGVTLNILNTFAPQSGTNPEYSGGGSVGFGPGATITTYHSNGLSGTFQVTGGVTFASDNQVTFQAPAATGSVLPDTISTLSTAANLTLNRPTVITTNALIGGELDNSVENLTISDNGLLILYAGASVKTTPIYGNTVNLSYVGNHTTGAEIPAAEGVINNLYFADGYLTLSHDLQVNGTLSTNGYHVLAYPFTLRHYGSLSGPLVFGNYELPVLSAGSRTWDLLGRRPENTAYDYHSPITIDFLSLDSAALVTAAILDTSLVSLGDLGGMQQILRRTYHLAKRDTFPMMTNITLRYADSDWQEAGIAADDSLKVFRRNGSDWTEQHILSRDPGGNNITVDSVSQFTDFVIAGTSRHGIAQLSGSALDFGNVRLNNARYDSVAVTNTGDYALIISYAYVGTASHWYGAFSGGQYPDTINVGETHVFRFSFTPQEVALYSGSVIFYHNGITGSDTVLLSGTGVWPLFVLSSTNLDMGTVALNSTKTDSVFVRNAGTSYLTIRSVVSTTPEYTAAPDTALIQPGDSVAFLVSFSPQLNGAMQGVIAFNHDASTAAESLYVSGSGIEAIFAASRTQISFGSVIRGQTKSDSISVRNDGQAKLNVMAASNNGRFTVSPSSASISMNDSAWFHFTFQPAGVAPDSGWIEFVHNGATTPDSLLLIGSSIEPLFTASKSSYDFGSIPVGSSATDTLHVTNTGTLELVISNAAVGDTANYRILPDTMRLAVGASGDFLITFAPLSQGQKTSAATFVHNALSSPTAVTLKGTGSIPVFSLSPGSLSFGNIRVGSVKTDSVTVANTGQAPLVISSISLTDTLQFSIHPKSATIAVGGNRKFYLSFSPQSVGAKNAAAAFIHNGVTSPSGMNLSGTGIQPSFHGSTTHLAYGEVRIGTSRIDSVVVTNAGSAPLTIAAVTDDPRYSVSPATATLLISEKKTFLVTFIPDQRATVGASVIFTHDGPTTPDTLRVDGTGIEPLFTLSSSFINLADVRVGLTKSDSIYVRNDGNTTLNIGLLTVEGSGFSIQPSSAVISAGAQQVFSVRAAPLTAGLKSGLIVFSHDATSSPDTLVCSALGVEPLFATASRLRNLGDIRIGTGRNDSVIVTNTGTASLTISGIHSSDSEFVVSPTSLMLEPDQSGLVLVTASPLARELAEAAIVFEHDAKTSPDTVVVQARGIEPVFWSQLSTINFGDVRVGTTENIPFSIANNGNMTLTISSADVSTEYYSVTPSSTTIAPGESRPFFVTFKALQRGQRYDALVIHHDGITSPDTVKLYGTAIEPLFVPTVDSLAFSEVRTMQSKTMQLTVTNPGNTNLAISSVTATDTQFTILPTTAEIAAGGSQEFTVTFLPSTRQDKAEKLIFTHNADSTPDTVTVTGRGIEPLFVASRRSVAFDTLRVHQTRTDTIVVNNPGNTALNISTITSSGTVFTIAPANAIVPAGGSTTFTVTFHATYGAQSDVFLFAHDAATSPDSIAISGTGVEPRFSASAASIAFGNVRVGAIKADSVEIRNTGNMLLSITGTTLDAPFTVRPAADSIMPGGSSWFVVSANPASVAVANGLLLFAHNGEVSPDSIHLSVRGIEPLFSVSSRSLELGNIRVGAMKTDSLIITNSGTADLTISDVVSSDAQVVVQPTSILVPAGASQVFRITAMPKSSGTKHAVLAFVHDAPSSPDTVSIVAIGIEPLFALSKVSVLFGQVRTGTSKNDSVVVRNPGSDALTIASAAVAGAAFAVSPAHAVVPSGDSVAFIVTFHSTTGTQSGTVLFAHDAASSPDSLALGGVGIEPQVAFSSRNVSFGSLRVDSARSIPVIVKNPGTATLKITSVASSDPQFIVTPTSATVAPLDSQAFQVRFIPSSRGDKAAALVFAHDGAGGVDTVTAVGTGIEPLFAATPLTLDLGSAAVGSVRQDSVLVRNDGTSTLSVVSVVTSSAEFSVRPLTASIEPSLTQWFVVSFEPTSAGAATSNLIFAHDARSVRDTVLINGMGTQPLFNPSSRLIAFGNVLVGDSHIDSMTVRNTGTAPLTITDVRSTDSTMRVVPAAAAIPPSGTAVFRVVFAPNSATAVVGYILFTHNASSLVDSVRITGTGVEPLFALSASSIQFGQIPSGTVKKDSIYVKNPGSAPLLITSALNAHAAFTVFPTQAAISPADSAKFVVMFSAQTGVARDTLVFVHNAKNSPSRLAMAGEGVQAKFSLTVDTMKFGSVRIDTLKHDSIIVRNTGTYALTISAVTASDSFFTVEPAQAVVPPGQTATFVVTFSPRTTGVKFAHLQFVHNGVSERDSIVLMGRGNPMTGFDDKSAVVPKDFVLDNSFPNPFNPSTTIRFGLPARGHVSVKIYNMIGQEIALLADGELEAGYHEVRWYATVPSGVYLYRMESTSPRPSGGRFSSVKKMILVR